MPRLAYSTVMHTLDITHTTVATALLIAPSSQCERATACCLLPVLLLAAALPP
jgi:hypothetical protein